MTESMSPFTVNVSRDSSPLAAGGRSGPDIRELRFDLRSPCADCPFRLDTPCHEGVAHELLNYVHSIDQGSFIHSCHKTDPRSDSDEGQRNVSGPVQHCAGAMIMLAKSRELSSTMIAASENGFLNLRRLNMKAPVGSVVQLAQRYLAWISEKSASQAQHDRSL